MTRSKMKDVDKEKQLKAIDKVYCSVKDIMTITGLSYPTAIKLARELVNDMEEKGEFVLSKKPILIPTKKVLRMLGLNANDFAK